VYRRVSVRIRRWHWGKIVILWAWGGLVAALLMSTFLSRKVEEDPMVSSLSSLGSVLILGVLTLVTWIWLGGKERAG